MKGFEKDPDKDLDDEKNLLLVLTIWIFVS